MLLTTTNRSIEIYRKQLTLNRETLVDIGNVVVPAVKSTDLEKLVTGITRRETETIYMTQLSFELNDSCNFHIIVPGFNGSCAEMSAEVTTNRSPTFRGSETMRQLSKGLLTITAVRVNNPSSHSFFTLTTPLTMHLMVY